MEIQRSYRVCILPCTAAVEFAKRGSSCVGWREGFPSPIPVTGSLHLELWNSVCKCCSGEGHAGERL